MVKRLRLFYKIRAKRTALLRQNFVMPLLCYGSAEQVTCSALTLIAKFTFHLVKQLGLSNRG